MRLNEPDEEQQMLHLLMCANEFDVEGLIAVTGKYLRPEDKNPYEVWDRSEIIPLVAYRRAVINVAK